MRSIRGICFLLFGALFFDLAAAQTATTNPEEELVRKVRAASEVTPLGSTPFGESISNYDGTLSFRQVDIDQPGLGLPLQLMRTYRTNDSWRFSAFVDWKLEIPHIETLSANASGSEDDTSTWFFLNDANRCSNFRQAPTIVLSSGSSPDPIFYFPGNWWNGYQLAIPGMGAQDLLLRDSSNTASPQMPSDGGGLRNFHIVTKKNWMVSCLASTSNGKPGEGFLVVSPDGIKYWMDWLAYKEYQKVGFAQPGFGGVARRTAMMMVSRVEDRFGNSLSYDYDANGDLLSIQASDGRKLVLSYEPWQGSGMSLARVRTATLSAADAPSRVWTYSYSAASSLMGVAQPDGSAWSFNLGLHYSGGASPIIKYGDYDRCSYDVINTTSNLYGSMVNPSGLTGEFSLKLVMRGRSYAPYLCSGPGLSVANAYTVAAMSQKKISGPGVQAQVWNYSYSPANQSWTKDCGSGCATSVWTDVTDPAGKAVRYTFSNRYDVSEGRLLRKDYFSGASGTSLLRAEEYAYAGATAGPWPARIGVVRQPNVNNDQLEQLAPVVKNTVTQEGGTYIRSIDGLDSFARPLLVTRSSSLGYSRADVNEYHDDLSLWALGQVKRTATNGIETSRTEYAWKASPTKTYAFGKLQQTIDYYTTNGAVASVTDGNGNKTSLSNWKRGIPQTITYADTTVQSATVNDNGWITAVTDENGYKTCYGYDTMGRVASITYPSETAVGVCDTSAWTSVAYSFVPTTAQFGIPAGHWAQVQTQGSYRKITHFDALWRPIFVQEEGGPGTVRYNRRTYDHEGRVTFEAYPVATASAITDLTKGTWTEYDALGRTTSVSQDSEQGLLSTVKVYLPNLFSQVTNPKGIKTVTRYMAYDQPTYEWPVIIDSASGLPELASVDITRDVFGKPLSIRKRDGVATVALTRNYTYNDYQELCRTVEPETGATLVGYDGSGNLAWSAAGLPGATVCDTAGTTAAIAARKVAWTYDARNRAKTLSFPDGVGNQVWDYTPDGLLSKSTTYNSNGGDSVVNAYSYNKRRLLTGESLQQPGWYTWSLGYGYNTNGAVSGITYPAGLYVDYAPNALGQATKAGTYASAVSYFPNGSVKQFTYGNGLVHTMTQNARQLPLQVRDGVDVLDNSYTYDKAGNVTQIADNLNGANTRTMSYDGLDRLGQASSGAFGGDGVLRYTYDVLDNIRSAKLAGVKQHNYVYDGNNRLTNVVNDGGSTTVGLSYDLQGNLSNKNGQVFQFDYGNRLRVVSSKESYRYDGAGRRVLAWSPTSGNILSMYGKDGVLRYQDDARRAKQISYISLNGSHVARVIRSLLPVAPTLSVPSYNAGGSYTVSWSVVSGASRYEVEEQTAGGAWQTWYSGTGTSQVVSGKGGGNYGYRARACISAGCGDWSAVATVSVELPPASAPGLAVPSLSGNGAYGVTWNSVAGATSYSLEESSNGGGWSGVYSGNGLSQSFSGKAAGSYSYRIRACNPAGCSGYSGVATVQVSYPPASAPTLSGGGTSTTGSYTLSWTEVATATSYTLEESGDSGASWSPIQSSAAISLSINGKGNGSYTYRVKACNVSGCGGYSANQTVTVAIPPAIPSNLKLIGKTSPTGTFTTYTATWSAVSGATRYEIGGASTYNGPNTSHSWTQGGDFSPVWEVRVRACNASACSAWSAYVRGVKQ